MEYLSSDFAGEVSVFDLSDVYRRIFKQQIAVPLQSTDMVGILMRYKDLMDGGGIYIQPPHLFCKPFVVISRVDHDRTTVLRVKEDIGDPLPDAGNMLIDPSGIQRLEDRFPPEQSAH